MTPGEYLQQVQRLLGQLDLAQIARVIDLLWGAYQQGRQVFVFGNGGSAATASHFACDLGKGTIVEGRPRFRVVALTDNVPLITAWANDTAYENVFAEQLENLLQPGDVVIGISTSGNSPNVLKAIELARAHGAVTIGWCGPASGRLASLVDHAVICPGTMVSQIEDAHHTLQHLVATVLKGRIETESHSVLS